MRLIRTLLFVALFAATATAQTLSMGNDFSPVPNQGDLNVGPVRTAIDLNTPVDGTGSISTVKFHWSASGCANAVKIKFFRRGGDQLTMLSERGPFSSATGGSSSTTVTLNPPVSVQQGDLIGIARIIACGNPVSWGPAGTDGYVSYAADVTGSVMLGEGTRSGSTLALRATGPATAYVVAVIPVVGSTAGSFGSNFRTSMQIHNSQVIGPKTIHGRLIFHRAGTMGTLSDPSLPYSIDPGKMIAFEDVVATMGQTGLGSIDVEIVAGDISPLVVTRIYNDAGRNGTSGMTEDLIMADMRSSALRFMARSSVGFLPTPIDIDRTRMNIGVRSWVGGATLTATLTDMHGTVLKTVTKSYPPNWFEQVDVTTFMGTPVRSNEVIRFTITSGAAIVYGSSTDNITNDPAAVVVFASYYET
ncbi:MAG: hypothetical protein ABI837_04270 [Acidobacteriota bacterium]